MSKLSYTIANMTQDDVSKIVELDTLSFGSHHWDSGSFYSEIQNDLAHYYVARDDSGEILGYIGF